MKSDILKTLYTVMTVWNSDNTSTHNTHVSIPCFLLDVKGLSLFVLFQLWKKGSIGGSQSVCLSRKQSRTVWQWHRLELPEMFYHASYYTVLGIFRFIAHQLLVNKKLPCLYILTSVHEVIICYISLHFS